MDSWVHAQIRFLHSESMCSEEGASPTLGCCCCARRVQDLSTGPTFVNGFNLCQRVQPSSTNPNTSCNPQGSSTGVLHRGPYETLGNPRKPTIFTYFSGFLVKNIMAFGQNDVIFELLRQKWCRIIYKFRQNTILDPKHAKLDQKSEIGHVRTCQDLFY